VSSLACDMQAGSSLRLQEKVQGPGGRICSDACNCCYFLGMLACELAGLLKVQCAHRISLFRLGFPVLFSHFLITVNSSLLIVTVSLERKHNLSYGIGVCRSVTLSRHRDASTAQEQKDIC